MKKKSVNFLKQSIKDYRFWLKLVIGSIQILSIFIFILNAFLRSVKGWGTTEFLVPGYYAIWINLSYFTTLSNLFCGSFFIHSAFYHHLEGKGKFNNDDVAKTAVTYVTMTILIYNISELAEVKPYNFKHWTSYCSFIFEHSLGPLFAVLYYLFFYDHSNVKGMKQFAQKHLGYMLIGLVGYGVLFWTLGELARIGNGFGFYYWNGAKEFGKGSHFVYPFLDFNHKPYFFKSIPASAESTIMLGAMVGLGVIIEFFYSFLAVKINNCKWQEKLFITKQSIENNKELEQIKNQLS